jgi:hypothetical protein
MSPQDIVREAVSALVARDHRRHLSLVAEDVVVQLNEGSRQNGKTTYRDMLKALRRCHELILNFTIVEDSTIACESVVRVREEHLAPRRQDSHEIMHREVLTSYYTVRGHLISQVKMAALSAPNRVFRYP